MKNLFLTLALVLSVNCLASTNEPTNDNKPTQETIFGTSFDIDQLVKVTYKDYYFYVAKNSPLAKAYKADKANFDVVMSLQFDNYSKDFVYSVKQ